uniref:Uncharacterized protein n=1 Tax=mine drainage metagenome TaxID=410659 RepID=E6QKZ5_9ZZZZ
MLWLRHLAQEGKGVGFYPVDFGVELVTVFGEVRLGDFEGCARGVDAGDALTDLGQMEGEAALVGADIEHLRGCVFGLCPASDGGVVFALIEECAGFLAGLDVEVKAEAIEQEDGLECGRGWLRGVERHVCGSRHAFEGANAWVGSFPEGKRGAVGIEVMANGGDDGGADGGGVQPAREELDDDQIGVLVEDDAGEIIGFAEDQAAGVGRVVEQGFAQSDGGVEAISKQGEPNRFVDMFAGYHAQWNLGCGAVERGSEEDAARVDNGQ